jgi:hypothetical protein
MDSSAYGIGYPEINLIWPIGNKNSRVNSRVFAFFKNGRNEDCYSRVHRGLVVKCMVFGGFFLSIYLLKKNSVISD